MSVRRILLLFSFQGGIGHRFEGHLLQSTLHIVSIATTWFWKESAEGKPRFLGAAVNSVVVFTIVSLWTI